MSSRAAGVATLLLAIFAFPAGAADRDAARQETWPTVRQSLFEARPIDEAPGEIIRLEAPVRAEDAATVPIAIRTGVTQSAARYINRVWLIIDKNPSPVAAIFQFTPDSGRAEMETRVRIEEYSNVRAVAEMNDGRLYMQTRFVKASGGCSAPAGRDPATAQANLGKMRLRVVDDLQLGRATPVQLMISHPNDSGLAMDQLTRLYTPAYFVRKVDVTYGGKLVMSADVDFSISENPNFRFHFLPQAPGELKAEVVDSRDLSFSTRLAVRPGTGQRGAEGAARPAGS